MDATKSRLKSIPFLRAASLPCFTQRDKKIADILIAFFFQLQVSLIILYPWFSLAAAARIGEKLFRRKLIRVFDFCMLTKKNIGKYLSECSMCIRRLVIPCERFSLTKQTFWYPVWCFNYHLPCIRCLMQLL